MLISARIVCEYSVFSATQMLIGVETESKYLKYYVVEHPPSHTIILIITYSDVNMVTLLHSFYNFQFSKKKHVLGTTDPKDLKFRCLERPIGKT